MHAACVRVLLLLITRALVRTFSHRSSSGSRTSARTGSSSDGKAGCLSAAAKSESRMRRQWSCACVHRSAAASASFAQQLDASTVTKVSKRDSVCFWSCEMP